MWNVMRLIIIKTNNVTCKTLRLWNFFMIIITVSTLVHVYEPFYDVVVAVVYVVKANRTRASVCVCVNLYFNYLITISQRTPCMCRSSCVCMCNIMSPTLNFRRLINIRNSEARRTELTALAVSRLRRVSSSSKPFRTFRDYSARATGK